MCRSRKTKWYSSKPFERSRGVRYARTPRAELNPYDELGVSRTADASEIKRAYRRAALERHPDVSKSPNAQEEFQRVQDAYRMLSDKTARARYDRAAARASGSAGSSWGASGVDDGAEAREYARRWRAQNPMPEDLDDSLGSVLSDLFGKVRDAGQGAPGVFSDLLDFLEGRTGPPSGEEEKTPADFALKSRSRDVVAAEIRDFDRRRDAANARADGADRDAAGLDARAAEWGRREENLRRSDWSAGEAAADMESELVAQAKRLRERAKESRAEAAAAERIRGRLQERLDLMKNDDEQRRAPEQAASAVPQSRQEREKGKKKAVDDELERMKREMGL